MATKARIAAGPATRAARPVRTKIPAPIKATMTKVPISSGGEGRLLDVAADDPPARSYIAIPAIRRSCFDGHPCSYRRRQHRPPEPERHHLAQHLGFDLGAHAAGLLCLTGIPTPHAAPVMRIAAGCSRLIADDAPEFSRIAPDIISGTCPPLLREFLEVRGLGILKNESIGPAVGAELKKQGVKAVVLSLICLLIFSTAVC